MSACRYSIVLRFKKAVTLGEEVARGFIAIRSLVDATYAESIMIHVDMLSQCSEPRELNNQIFSAYVGSNLCMRPRNPSDDNCSDFVHLSIDVTIEEYTHFNTLATNMVSRGIPYNYSDLLFIPLPCSRLVRNLLTDTDNSDKDLETPSTLYCSQFAVLILKRCISYSVHPDLSIVLKNLNSRCVSPHMLYKLLLPHSDELHLI
jgi:hypothetical protein